MNKNELGSEKSPYLLQHRDNPVHWRPWGEAAFAEAKAKNKPIFLSIGYSTCYWCHVMEKDSFEQEVVAEALNRGFIAIKVDREERPDVDEIYMDAVIAMTGQGGWPMSVFLTPDGKPFFAGTYFPRVRFLDILSRIEAAWKTQSAEIIATGENVLAHFSAQEQKLLEVRPTIDDLAHFNQAAQAKALSDFSASFDDRDGGFGHAPKFPPAQGIGLLLRIFSRTKSLEAIDMATLTLDRMACGGIFDQVGGGFHRYSTDEKWLVPHFEKMLYDNALLSLVYSEAFLATGKELYADVVRLTLDYVLREMHDREGGFYSAQDAGEVNREGEFYVWDYEDVVKAVGPEASAELSVHFGLTRAGNFEGATNILHLDRVESWQERKNPRVKAALETLFQLRSQRKAPHLDDKVLTGWNGLMIAAMARAHQTLGEGKYLQAAQDAAKFIEQKLWVNCRLLRRYRAGSAGIQGTLEDYSYFIYGLLSLYESDFDERWLKLAETLQNKQEELFSDLVSGGYFSATTDDPHLVFRKRDAYDGAVPSPNSVAALNLEKLARYFHRPEFSQRAQKVLAFLSAIAERAPNGLAFGLQAFDFAAGPSQEISLIGEAQDPSVKIWLGALRKEYRPSRVIACGHSTDLPMLAGRSKEKLPVPRAYVCTNSVCLNPVYDKEALERELR